MYTLYRVIILLSSPSIIDDSINEILGQPEYAPNISDMETFTNPIKI